MYKVLPSPEKAINPDINIATLASNESLTTLIWSIVRCPLPRDPFPQFSEVVWSFPPHASFGRNMRLKPGIVPN